MIYSAFLPVLVADADANAADAADPDVADANAYATGAGADGAKRNTKARHEEILLISLKQICLNERREIHLHTNHPWRRACLQVQTLQPDFKDGGEDAKDFQATYCDEVNH